MTLEEIRRLVRELIIGIGGSSICWREPGEALLGGYDGRERIEVLRTGNGFANLFLVPGRPEIVETHDPALRRIPPPDRPRRTAFQRLIAAAEEFNAGTPTPTERIAATQVLFGQAGRVHIQHFRDAQQRTTERHVELRFALPIISDEARAQARTPEIFEPRFRADGWADAPGVPSAPPPEPSAVIENDCIACDGFGFIEEDFNAIEQGPIVFCTECLGSGLRRDPALPEPLEAGPQATIELSNTDDARVADIVRRLRENPQPIRPVMPSSNFPAGGPPDPTDNDGVPF